MTMQADPFLHFARVNKPYVLLWEPDSGRAAAYDACHRLVTEQPSAALVDFALKRHVHSEPWDELQSGALGGAEPPSWAQQVSLSRCRLYWLRDGWSKLRDLLDTPDA